MFMHPMFLSYVTYVMYVSVWLYVIWFTRHTYVTYVSVWPYVMRRSAYEWEYFFFYYLMCLTHVKWGPSWGHVSNMSYVSPSYVTCVSVWPYVMQGWHMNGRLSCAKTFISQLFHTLCVWLLSSIHVSSLGACF